MVEKWAPWECYACGKTVDRARVGALILCICGRRSPCLIPPDRGADDAE